MKYYCLILLILLSAAYKAQPFLYIPVEGEIEKDFIVVNYVDWELIGFQDAYCGSKSYDGHEGTDFTLKNFSQMNSGVNVLAADSGVVTYLVDSIFDREKVSDTSKKLGNYIAIKHPNGYYSYYGHLKKNSVIVSVGDTVSAKQIIAQVGSSGNSSDPHLHFELWFDSLYVVDPFRGDCGNQNSLWLDSIKYDTSIQFFDKGYYLKSVTLDSLRERVSSAFPLSKQIEYNPNDTLTFWSHLQGLKNEDTLSILWKDSLNQVKFSSDFIQDRDWWYYYFWSYMPIKSLGIGDWKVELQINRLTMIEDSFSIVKPITTNLQEKRSVNKDECKKLRTAFEKSPFEVQENALIQIYNLNGQQVSINTGNYNSSAIYVVQITKNRNSCVFKILR